MCTTDENHVRRMTFQVAAVHKALGSVSKIVANTSDFVKKSCSVCSRRQQHVEQRDRLWLREDQGVCVLGMLLATDFTRHAELAEAVRLASPRRN